MGVYAVPSKQPFIAKNPVKTKRKRGRIDDLMEFFEGTNIVENDSGEIMLMRGNELVGVFTEDEDENGE